MLKSKIKKGLDFIFKLIGTKYGWWNKDDMRYNEIPSFSLNKKIPTIKYIKNKKCNCVGVINLIRRINNLQIPGTENSNYKYPGGTYIWFNYLYKNKKLEKFNKNKIYPRGTLLLKKYKNYKNKGHVAVIYKSSKINSKIIHSWVENSIPNKNKNNPGIIIEKLSIYDKYFTHICLPNKWLN